MVRSVPDPFASGDDADEAQVVQAQLGLHLPLHQQCAQWLGGVLQGDLDRSVWTGRPVADLVVRITSIIGLTLPSFWVGVLLLYVTSMYHPTRCTIGYAPFADDPIGNLARTALPTFAVSLPMIAVITVIGVQVGYLLSGVVVIEQVFAIPGLARLVVGARNERDYPLAQGVLLVTTGG